MRHCRMRVTRSSILVVFAICTLCLTRETNCDNDGQKSVKKAIIKADITEKPTTTKNDSLTGNNNNNNDAASKQQTGANITAKTTQAIVENKVNAISTSLPEPIENGHPTTINSGAVVRGFYVLVGLSVMTIAYMVFRSFRVNKHRPQMVRKYGILAHKQDIEMRPLPLDEEDDDDTTLFDASGLSPSRLQS